MPAILRIKPKLCYLQVSSNTSTMKMTLSRRRTKYDTSGKNPATGKIKKIQGTPVTPTPGSGKKKQQRTMNKGNHEEHHSESDSSDHQNDSDSTRSDDESTESKTESRNPGKEMSGYVAKVIRYAKTAPTKRIKNKGFHTTIMTGLRKYLRKNCYGKHKFIRNDIMACKFISRAAVSGDVMIPCEYTMEEFKETYQNRMYKALNDLRHNGQSLARKNYMGMCG